MQQLHRLVFFLTVIAFAFFMAGCASVQYETFDTKDKSEWTDKDHEAYARLNSSGAEWIDFEDDEYAGAVVAYGDFNSEEGLVEVLGEDSHRAHEAYKYNSGQKFESVTVCWRTTSDKGHLILWVPIEGYGMPTFFNDVNGYGGHVHLDSLGGDTEGIGWQESSYYKDKWITQEVSVDGKDIVFKRNGKEFSRYSMDRPRKLDSFTTGTNSVGAGEVVRGKIYEML
jgi:hypothetical protein